MQKQLLPLYQHHGCVVFWPDLATGHYSLAATRSYKDNGSIIVVPKEVNSANCPELRLFARYWAKRNLKVYGTTCEHIKNFKF